MTPRENFLRFFQGKPYEKIPHSEDFLLFQPEELVESVCRGFVFQEQPFDRKNFGGKDFFGVEWFFEELAGGSMEVSQLFEDISQWREYVHFPDLEAIDWEKIADRNRNYLKTDRLIRTTLFTGFFERLISLVGFENAAMALIDDEAEEAVHGLFNELSNFYIELIKRLRRHFNVEYIQLHDDWGTQNAPMFSRSTLENMILPYVRFVIQEAHREGCLVEFHSCGQITDFVSDIIEMGADTWCGQTTAIDKPALVRQYGKSFRFGVGILPDAEASEDDIRAEVRKLKSEYKGKEVWYFISSSHRPDLIAPIVEELEASGP